MLLPGKTSKEICCEMGAHLKQRRSKLFLTFLNPNASWTGLNCVLFLSRDQKPVLKPIQVQLLAYFRNALKSPLC